MSSLFVTSACTPSKESSFRFRNVFVVYGKRSNLPWRVCNSLCTLNPHKHHDIGTQQCGQSPVTHTQGWLLVYGMHLGLHCVYTLLHTHISRDSPLHAYLLQQIPTNSSLICAAVVQWDAYFAWYISPHANRSLTFEMLPLNCMLKTDIYCLSYSTHWQSPSHQVVL